MLARKRAQRTHQDGWEYRYISPVIEQLTRRPPDFFLPSPQRWLQVVHPEDRQRWQQAFAHLSSLSPPLDELAQTNQEEFRVVWPDGTVRWLRESVRVSQEARAGNGHDSATLRLDGILTDITDRKHTEKVLSLERNLLRTLIDNLPDYIFVKDTRSRFVTNNIAHRRVLKAATLDEVVGKTDFDFFPAPWPSSTMPMSRRSCAPGNRCWAGRNRPSMRPGARNGY